MIFYGTLIGILIYIAVQLHHIKMLLKKDNSIENNKEL